MRSTVKLTAMVLLAVPLTGVAQQQLSCVKDIVYSPEFVAKYPRAGAACNEVIVSKGEKWARFNAEVKNRQGYHLTVDFIDDQDRPVANMTFEMTPDATVTLRDEHQVKPAAKLQKGEKIVVWVPEKRFGFYAEPGASESKHFAVLSDDSAKKE
jgi:hypothetical protein